VLGGSLLSSIGAALLADWLGRKTMMIVSGLMFVVSVGLIMISQGFLPLFAGRLLQGMSGGVIAVVVPLYLAECLSAGARGRGTAIFQFTLTIGIVIASIVGLAYTHRAEAAIQAAAGNAVLITAAENAAWRTMFLSVVYPGLIFLIGAFFLSESPRWLYRRGQPEKAMAALRRSCSEEEAQLEMAEIDGTRTKPTQAAVSTERGTLLKRKYIVPFILACVILACNQATGFQVEAGQESRVGGWGFPHGDEGGGAWLGLEAIRRTLHWLDGRAAADPLLDAVYARFDGDLSRLVVWANAANSTDFGEIAPLVIAHIGQRTPLALLLMREIARELDQIGQALTAKSRRPLPCCMLGGLGPFVEPYLEKTLRARLVPSREEPVQGALLMIRAAVAAGDKVR
jgi:MFS family permease